VQALCCAAPITSADSVTVGSWTLKELFTQDPTPGTTLATLKALFATLPELGSTPPSLDGIAELGGLKSSKKFYSAVEHALAMAFLDLQRAILFAEQSMAAVSTLSTMLDQILPDSEPLPFFASEQYANWMQHAAAAQVRLATNTLLELSHVRLACWEKGDDLLAARSPADSPFNAFSASQLAILRPPKPAASTAAAVATVTATTATTATAPTASSKQSGKQRTPKVYSDAFLSAVSAQLQQRGHLAANATAVPATASTPAATGTGLLPNPSTVTSFSALPPSTVPPQATASTAAAAAAAAAAATLTPTTPNRRVGGGSQQ